MAWLSTRIRHRVAALLAVVVLAGSPFSAWASIAHVRPQAMPQPCHTAMDETAASADHATHRQPAVPAMSGTLAICCNVIVPALLPFVAPGAVEREWRHMPKAASDTPLGEVDPLGLERPPRPSEI